MSAESDRRVYQKHSAQANMTGEKRPCRCPACRRVRATFGHAGPSKSFITATDIFRAGIGGTVSGRIQQTTVKKPLSEQWRQIEGSKVRVLNLGKTDEVLVAIVENEGQYFYIEMQSWLPKKQESQIGRYNHRSRGMGFPFDMFEGPSQYELPEPRYLMTPVTREQVEKIILARGNVAENVSATATAMREAFDEMFGGDE